METYERGGKTYCTHDGVEYKIVPNSQKPSRSLHYVDAKKVTAEEKETAARKRYFKQRRENPSDLEYASIKAHLCSPTDFRNELLIREHKARLEKAGHHLSDYAGIPAHDARKALSASYYFKERHVNEERIARIAGGLVKHQLNAEGITSESGNYYQRGIELSKWARDLQKRKDAYLAKKASINEAQA